MVPPQGQGKIAPIFGGCIRTFVGKGYTRYASKWWKLLSSTSACLSEEWFASVLASCTCWRTTMKLTQIDAKIKETPQYSQERAIFQISADSARDVSCDVITMCVQPRHSSIHVCRTAVQLKVLVYRQISLRKTIPCDRDFTKTSTKNFASRIANFEKSRSKSKPQQSQTIL